MSLTQSEREALEALLSRINKEPASWEGLYNIQQWPEVLSAEAALRALSPPVGELKTVAWQDPKDETVIENHPDNEHLIGGDYTEALVLRSVSEAKIAGLEGAREWTRDEVKANDEFGFYFALEEGSDSWTSAPYQLCYLLTLQHQPIQRFFGPIKMPPGVGIK